MDYTTVNPSSWAISNFSNAIFMDVTRMSCLLYNSFRSTHLRVLQQHIIAALIRLSSDVVAIHLFLQLSNRILAEIITNLQPQDKVAWTKQMQIRTLETPR